MQSDNDNLERYIREQLAFQFLDCFADVLSKVSPSEDFTRRSGLKAVEIATDIALGDTKEER